jgi:hypothetical protein
MRIFLAILLLGVGAVTAQADTVQAQPGTTCSFFLGQCNTGCEGTQRAGQCKTECTQQNQDCMRTGTYVGRFGKTWTGVQQK